MVALDIVKASNATISDNLPEGLVAVFTGATSGIAEAAIKLLVRKAAHPKIYLVGRSSEAAARIIAELRTSNPGGEYIFIQKNLLLLKEVEELSEEIRKKEKYVNLLVLAAGGPDRTLEKTPEGLRPIVAIHVHSRLLLTTRLLPLINAAPGLKRVLSIAAGGYEGAIDTTDFNMERTSSPFTLRAHLSTLITLVIQHVARENPKVTFTTNHPGTVVTASLSQVSGLYGAIVKSIVFLFGRWITVPLEESAERHLFLATSSAFAPPQGDFKGVPLVPRLETHVGVDGKPGSGFYSVLWDNEGPGEKVIKLVDGYNEDGTAEKTWNYIQEELARVEKENKS